LNFGLHPDFSIQLEVSLSKRLSERLSQKLKNLLSSSTQHWITTGITSLSMLYCHWTHTTTDTHQHSCRNNPQSVMFNWVSSFEY